MPLVLIKSVRLATIAGQSGTGAIVMTHVDIGEVTVEREAHWRLDSPDQLTSINPEAVRHVPVSISSRLTTALR